MKTSSTMRELIREFEGCRLVAYQDPVGIYTIGCGHCGVVGNDPVGPGMRITQQQADELLAMDLERFETSVERLCPGCSQQQFDALVSFAFNVGSGALQNSTLRKHHTAGNHAAAANEFHRWNKAGGKVLAGLTRRRAAESRVYAQGDYGGGSE